MRRRGADEEDYVLRVIRQAAEALRRRDVVIGPAEDGSYYLIGLNRPLPWLFAPMAWGTDAVFATTMERLRARGIEPALLPTLADLDRPEDLARWPNL